MAYRIEIDRRALRSLKRLPNDARKRLAAAIDALASEPRPDGVTKLTGREEWRIRVGVYGLIYAIDDTQAHRRDRSSMTKRDALSTIQPHMVGRRARFGVEDVALFGSVVRDEAGPERRWLLFVDDIPILIQSLEELRSRFDSEPPVDSAPSS